MHPPGIGINAGKPSARLIIIPRPEVIEPGIGIKLLPGVEKVILRASAAVQQITEGIVIIAVRYSPAAVDKLAAGELPVVEIIRKVVPILGDQVIAVEVGNRKV
nr:hypothetical protein [Candidatus Electrothrix aestuarii]